MRLSGTGRSLRSAVALAVMVAVVIPAAVGAADTEPPVGTIELYDLSPRDVTFRLTASDPSGIDKVTLSCDGGATWIERPFAHLVTVLLREGGLGCVGYEPRRISVVIFDTAGNGLTGGGTVGLAPELKLEFPLPAVTGQPFTIRPVLPDDYAMPAEWGCRWEFRWGNNRSLDLNDHDDTYGAMLFDIPSMDGGCGEWTFTLPWVPFRQFEVNLGLLEFDPDGGVSIGVQVQQRFAAAVGGTDRLISASNLPVVQVLPSTYTPIVGRPVTYTRYLIGGALACCTPTWSARQGAGNNPNSWHQSGGATFTITPREPGNIVVGWDRLTGQYRLGAAYDPPVRYRDVTRPNTTTPLESIGGARQTDGVPVTFKWTGSDRGWGLDRYQLQRRVNGGAWKWVALPSPRATSVVQALPTGHSYRYRVRAVDKAGNLGFWDYGPTFRPRIVQETSAAITYRRSWPHVADPSASGGGLRETTVSAATATHRFTGRGVAWLAERGPGRGLVDVYLDGVRVATVDLAATVDSQRLVVFRRRYTGVGNHTLVLRNRATAGRPGASLDAVLILR